MIPNSFQLVEHRGFQYEREDIEPWLLAPSRERSYKKLKEEIHMYIYILLNHESLFLQ